MAARSDELAKAVGARLGDGDPPLTRQVRSKIREILDLASRAFAEDYDKAEILKWLQVFYRRFFSQQFKRSCLPDGPKVGSVSLSPRGDWRMPSDASAELWLAELEEIAGDA